MKKQKDAPARTYTHSEVNEMLARNQERAYAQGFQDGQEDIRKKFRELMAIAGKEHGHQVS